MKIYVVILALILALIGTINAEPCQQTYTSDWTSDWNGETYDNYEDYAANSTVTFWGTQGVVMTKEKFTYMMGFFGVAISAIMTWALFKAVL